MAVEIKEARLPLESLCLDPNNPRFADLDVAQETPEERAHEPSVQERALARMLEERFDVEQLKQSILKVGFLEVDRLVVVPLPVNDRFLVVEGNRRVAALRSLVDDEQAGIISLTAALKEKLKALPVVVIEGEGDERTAFGRRIQGLRHTPGVKPWGPYQQAQFIARLVDQGATIPEIKTTLGLSTQRVNSLLRVHRALEQMKKHEEFGELAKPHLFSNFEEALKVPRVREWLQWDDDTGQITHPDHQVYLYRWFVGEEDENGNRLPPKIIDAKDIRDFPRLLDDPPALQRFMEDPRLSLRDAARSIRTEPSVDWRAALQDALRVLRQVPAIDIADAREADLSLIGEIGSICERLLSQSARPQGGELTGETPRRAS